MSTRLSGVEIPISLDTSKALQQLDTLEKKLEKDESAAKATTKAAQSAIANTKVANQMRQAGGGSGPSGAPSAAQGALSKLSGPKLGGPFGQVASGAAGVAGRLIPEQAMGAIKFAGAVAFGYGVASATAQKLPELTFALEKITGLEARISGLQSGLENLRRGFSTFESGVTTLPKSIGEVKEMAELSFRLGGGVPNINALFKQVHMANVYESELDKKFNQFKNKEIYAGAGEDFRRYAERTAEEMRRSFGMKGNN